MKKGLLLAIGVTATIGLVAQAQQERVAVKMNLTLEQTTRVDAEDPSFYSQAHNSMRYGNNPSVQMAGTQFSSSRNNLTLLVSQSNCMTADQTLGVAMFTHRISADWSPAGVNSGFIQNSWTANNGGSWDSCYTDNDGAALFRYPSGAILNQTGNTNIANAWMAIAGPYTDGSGWKGYYLSGDALVTNAGYTGNPVLSPNVNSFPRIDIASYSDNSVWVTGGLYTDASNGAGYHGAALNKGSWNGSALAWTMDSITPAFHQDGGGLNDCYTMTHLVFSSNGQTGYAVFFGVQASATTPETRAFQPIVYSTTDGGATWSAAWAPFDYTTIPVIAQNIYPTGAGDLKPWFSMNNGSDVVVDNTGNLHVICTIESGYSNHDDSLGYTTTFTNIPVGNAHHYIYDVYTTGSNTWDAVLIDSLVTTNTSTQSPFSDGSTPYDLDARIQASVSPTGDHIFYFWGDTDPSVAGGENAYPDLFGVGVDWTTDMKTAKKQFTTDAAAYYHYNSNRALVSGSTYTIPSTNSIDRDGSHSVLVTWDHYYLNNVTFDEAEFTIPVGISESVASFGTVGAYPNPANDVLNLNINLNNNEEVVINMYNTIGQIVLTQTSAMTAGANSVQLNTANLEAGVYFLNVTVGDATSTTKVIVE